jgi:hypothetical protein
MGGSPSGEVGTCPSRSLGIVSVFIAQDHADALTALDLTCIPIMYAVN